MQSMRGWMKSILAFSLVFFLSVGIFGLSGCDSKDETNEPSIGVGSEQSVLSNDDEAGNSPIYTDWPFDADEALRRQEETAETLGIPVEYENEIGMKFRLIPAGEFMMGSKLSPQELVKIYPDLDAVRYEDEHPQHRVRITKPFYLGVCEVTQSEWESVMGTTPWRGKSAFENGAYYPATWIPWGNTQEFCRRLSDRDGMNYRLPTEAEWEYACRAGSTTAFCFGDSDSSLGEYAWYDENAGDRGQQHPSEVGRKEANAWGLHDMHGNVREWCHDWYDSHYYEAGTVDPRGPPSDIFRVTRGGCWCGYPQFCRSAKRDKFPPEVGGTMLTGFRVACSVELNEDYPAPAVESDDDGSADTRPSAVTPSAPDDVVAAPSLDEIDPGEATLDTVWLFDAEEAQRRQEETAKALNIPVDYANEMDMKFRLIPAGEFMMGSPEDEEGPDNNESPVHSVRLTKSFYLGVYEVTQSEWQAVMGTTPGRGKIDATDGPNYPATYVSWEDVQEFCQRLSARDGMSYRLPIEAEWEYACRAGSTTAYCFGDSDSNLGSYAWYRNNAYDQGQRHPSEIGRKQANAWGLHDMHGNVWEWCQDWYRDHYYIAGAVDPVGPSAGLSRVYRGGSWSSRPGSCRSAERYGHAPYLSFNHMGFRLACSVE